MKRSRKTFTGHATHKARDKDQAVSMRASATRRMHERQRESSLAWCWLQIDIQRASHGRVQEMNQIMTSWHHFRTLPSGGTKLATANKKGKTIGMLRGNAPQPAPCAKTVRNSCGQHHFPLLHHFASFNHVIDKAMSLKFQNLPDNDRL